MTTFYPSQPTPQFLKKYTRNVYNRVQHNAHIDSNGHPSLDETPISLQPYRSTPLILPGAKVYQNKNLPTDCYLRHHPNPQMRVGPSHEYVDSVMKQKVADSVLHRVVEEQQQQQNQYQQQYQAGPPPQQQQQQYQVGPPPQAYSQPAYPQQAVSNGPKLVHKQFNSPIGLYSDSNIENTIKNTISPLSPVASSMGSSSVPSPNGTLNRHQQLPTKIQGYKKTVVFDPLKSETYRALQESTYSNDKVHEVAAPAQTRVFKPNKLVPGKKPVASFPPPDPISRIPVNAMGDASEVIHQSNSFYRLMHSVMGETDY